MSEEREPYVTVRNAPVLKSTPLRECLCCGDVVGENQPCDCAYQLCPGHCMTAEGSAPTYKPHRVTIGVDFGSEDQYVGVVVQNGKVIGIVRGKL